MWVLWGENLLVRKGFPLAYTPGIYFNIAIQEKW
jgi:hypothetical protein